MMNQSRLASNVIPPDLEALPVVIELAGLDESMVSALRGLFDGDDEDVTFSDAFGGVDTIAIVTTLRRAFETLASFFAAGRTIPSKTVLKISKGAIELKGFSAEDANALLTSPAFQKAVAAIGRK